MRIDYFAAEEFRGLRGLELKNLGDVNLLLGDNDAGKTSVLEAIKLFEAPTSIDMIIRNSRQRSVSQFSRDTYTQIESLLSLFPFEQGEIKRLSLCAGIGGRTNELTLSGELSRVLRPVSEEEIRWYSVARRTKAPQMTEQEVLTFCGQLNYAGKIQEIAIDEYYRYQVGISVQERLNRPIVYVGPGEHLNSRTAYSAFRTSKRQEEEIVDVLRLIDPEIEGFKMQPNSITGGMNQIIEHRRFGNVPLYTYGDGMKKIFSLAASVLDARGGILMIDEIETSLQASNLRYVFDWLLKVGRRLDVQLFVTTHSLESVSGLASCAVAAEESELVCYRLEKEKEQVYAKRFSESELNTLVNGRGIDVR